MSEQNLVTTETQGHRNLLVLLFAGFVLSGIATTIIGPMLPIFIRRWSLDDGQAGLFSSIQFLAALGGTLASSAIATWRGYKPPLVLGYALMGGGLACLNANTHAVALMATAVFGLGYGLITPGTNLFVAELGGAKSASLLNQLNFAWGAGAMACSALIALALKHNALSILLGGTAIFGGILVVGLSIASFSVEKHREDPSTPGAAPPAIAISVTIAMAAMFYVFLCRPDFRPRCRTASSKTPAREKNSAGRTESGGGRHDLANRVQIVTGSHLGGFPARTRLRECLSHFHCLALAVVWSKREKNWRHSFCARISRRICRLRVHRSGFQIFWQFASRIARAAGLRGDSDFPDASAAPANNGLRYS